MRLLFVTLPIVALLAACNKEPPQPKLDTGPLPAQVCTEVKKSLDKLNASTALDIGDNGDATIESELWLQMTPDQRDALAHALAFHASCVSGHQSAAQEVNIHAEDGTLLMHRIVATRINLQDALGGGGGDVPR